MSAYIAFVLRIAVGIVFLASASTKLADFNAFAVGLCEYGLPSRRAALAAALLVSSEVALAIAHLLGWHLSVVGPLAMLLIGVFIVVTANLLYRGRTVPCLCFGARNSDPVSARTLARLILLGLGETTLCAIVWQSHPDAPWPAQIPEQILGSVLAVILLVATSWFLRTADVVAGRMTR